MKTYTATFRTSATLKNVILGTINNHQKYVKSYFWSPARNATGRRQNERRFPLSSFNIITGNGIIKVRPSYRESCGNCYYRMEISLDNHKKSIRLLKGLI
jgi:hypothetical protein